MTFDPDTLCSNYATLPKIRRIKICKTLFQSLRHMKWESSRHTMQIQKSVFTASLPLLSRLYPPSPIALVNPGRAFPKCILFSWLTLAVEHSQSGALLQDGCRQQVLTLPNLAWPKFTLIRKIICTSGMGIRAWWKSSSGYQVYLERSLEVDGRRCLLWASQSPCAIACRGGLPLSAWAVWPRRRHLSQDHCLPPPYPTSHILDPIAPQWSERTECALIQQKQNKTS